MLFSRRPLVGVAIEPRCIRLVQLQRARHGFELLHAASHTLPDHVFQLGKITDWDTFGRHLHALAADEKLSHQVAASCMPSNQVKLKTCSLPVGLSAADMQAEVSIQMQRELAGRAEMLAVDFAVSKAQTVKNYVDVLCAAVRNSYLEQYQAAFAAADIRLKIVDVDIFALIRAATQTLKNIISLQEKNCLLFVSAHYAVMVCWQQDNLIFHQQWDAEAKSSVAMSLRQWLDWCGQTYARTAVNCLIVAGEHDELYSCMKIFSVSWGCRIVEPDPFSNMKAAAAIDKSILKDNPSVYLLAVGLAMREVPAW